MTTIINLNVLNIFALKGDTKTFHNNLSSTDSSKTRENSFPDQRIIDVTPSHPAIGCNNPVPEKIRDVPVKIPGQPEVLTCYPEKREMSILKAYSSAVFMPKGTNIDSYA